MQLTPTTCGSSAVIAPAVSEETGGHPKISALLHDVMRPLVWEKMLQSA